MKIKLILAVALFGFILQSCKDKVANPDPQYYIQADYRINTFFKPCGFTTPYIYSYRAAGSSYSQYSYCSGTAGTSQPLSMASFKSYIYSSDYMAANTDGGPYAVTPTSMIAPAGTVRCTACANGAHVICEDASGVITLRGEHPSVYGILDADGTAILTNFKISTTPFSFLP